MLKNYTQHCTSVGICYNDLPYVVHHPHCEILDTLIICKKSCRLTAYGEEKNSSPLLRLIHPIPTTPQQLPPPCCHPPPPPTTGCPHPHKHYTNNYKSDPPSLSLSPIVKHTEKPAHKESLRKRQPLTPSPISPSLFSDPLTHQSLFDCSLTHPSICTYPLGHPPLFTHSSTSSVTCHPIPVTFIHLSSLHYDWCCSRHNMSSHLERYWTWFWTSITLLFHFTGEVTERTSCL